MEISERYKTIYSKINRLFISISARFRNGVKNVKIYPSADTNSDHNPVIATLRVYLKSMSKSKTTKKYVLVN